ncbi:MAG: molecular chaperone HtpG, partial [Bacteroidetes bacterium]|nr:molecular chaperone HtpG [Bacteroidota bacterium]
KEAKLDSVLSAEEEESLKKVFEENVKDKNFSIELKALSPEDMPVMITQSEWMRRMKEMQQLSGGMSFMGDFPGGYNLVVNSNHPIAQKLLSKELDPETKVGELFDLALLGQGMLKGKKLTEFIERSMQSLV